MNDPMSPEERRTLEVVRQAMRRPGDDSDDMIDMVMTGYDLTMADGPTALISEDTALTGLAAVRAGDGGSEPRFVSCESEGVHFEFEIETSRIIGMVDPPRHGRVVLQQPDDTAESAIGRSGSFELPLAGTSPFRLVLHSDDGQSVATEWVLP